MLLALTACGGTGESSPIGKTRFELTYAFRAGEIVGKVEGQQQFLRVRASPKFDLVFDDRFAQLHDPDFMAVTPTQFGLGHWSMRAGHRVGCSDMMFYACGTRLTVAGETLALIFRDVPETDTPVIEQVAEAEAWLAARAR